MLRTIFMIGLFALLGLFALKLAFGLFGFLFVILWKLLIWAVYIAIVGLIVYFLIRIVSPDTAHRLRSRWSGP
jgi:ABC-type Na+ efflux pump permease subunit